MKRTVHFSGVSGRESCFDPTKNRDILRSIGKLEELPSCRLHYDLGVAYEYQKRHSPSPVCYDLNRSARFAGDAKSVKKKQEEAEEEAKKLILYPNFEVCSNKGKSFAKVSFTKAERKLIATPLDLQPKAVSPRKVPPRKQDDEDDEEQAAPQEDEPPNPIGRLFSPYDDVLNPAPKPFQPTLKPRKEEPKGPTEEELAAIKRKEEAKAAAAARQAEREKVWREMHNHVPGEYRFGKCPGRDGFAPAEMKRKQDIARRRKVGEQRSKTVPLQERDRSTSPSSAEARTRSPSPSDSFKKKAKDVSTYQLQRVMENERNTRDLRAPLFRSYTGREKPVLGQAKDKEVHQYPVELDPEGARRAVCDKEEIGQSFTVAKRILDPPIGFIKKLAGKDKSSGKRGSSDPVVSPLGNKGPQRNTIFDNLLQDDKEEEEDEESNGPKRKKPVPTIAERRKRPQPVPHTRAKTGFHLEDFLHSKKFKKKLREYEEEVIRTNLEALEAAFQPPKHVEEADLDGARRSPRNQNKALAQIFRDKEKPVDVGPAPRKITLEEEQIRQEKLAHLAALTGLSLEHDDIKHQWKGALPMEKRLVVDFGALNTRDLDTTTLSSWTTPLVSKMIKLGKVKEHRREVLDREYRAQLQEYTKAKQQASAAADQSPSVPPLDAVDAPPMKLPQLRTAEPKDAEAVKPPRASVVKLPTLSEFILSEAQHQQTKGTG